MNIRESGARSARRITTTLGVIGATVASIIGVSVWAGTTASASTSTVTTQGDDESTQQGFGTSSGLVSPSQGGQISANSNGS